MRHKGIKWAALGGLFALLVLLAVIAVPRSAQAGEDLPSGVERLYGSSRYDTAIAVAEHMRELREIDQFHCVVLATGEGFADALSGGYLAIKKNAPILLTNASHASMVNEYIRSKVAKGSTIYVLGGTKAFPVSWQNGLGGYIIKRLSGTTRYDTNLAILKEVQESSAFLLVATGENYADALAASGCGYPIMLVKDELTKEQKAYLKSISGLEIWVLGGTDAISSELYDSLDACCDDIERVAGSTRYETAAKFSEQIFNYMSSAIVVIGNNFPDGLAAGPPAYMFDAPILLINGKTQDHRAAKRIMDSYDIGSGFVLGGPTLITTNTVLSLFRRG